MDKKVTPEEDCPHCDGTGEVPILIKEEGDNIMPGGHWVESGKYEKCVCVLTNE